MPFGRIDYCGMLGVILRVGLQLCQCFIRSLGIKITAVLIIGINILRETHCAFFIIRDKQPHRLCAAFHTSGSIDTRPYLIHQITDGNRFPLYTGHPHDSPQTYGRLRIESTKAIESQYPVLPCQRHYVAGYGHG